MKHYVCTGGCEGVAETPGVCQTKDCSLYGHALKECDCENGKHAAILGSQESENINNKARTE